jgi:hypothetical protein
MPEQRAKTTAYSLSDPDSADLAAPAHQDQPRTHSRAPALGERSALTGYVPQYEIAAGVLLRTLTNEELEWLALVDPEAGRLDDFQIATPGRLDAFQVKWSEAGGQMSWSSLRSFLVELISDRRNLAAKHPDRRVIGILVSNQVASASRIKAAPRGVGQCSPARAVTELLLPATRSEYNTVDSVPAKWQWLLRALALECELTPAETLRELEDVRIDLGQRRPSESRPAGESESVPYKRDLDDLLLMLLRLATDPAGLVRVGRDELLERLGDRWRHRLSLRSIHDFPTPSVYQPISATAEVLRKALRDFMSGYVAVVGTPGCGKSTLLTQELRGREDVKARYYAYVPGRTDIGAARATAEAFLHDLVLTLERAGLPRGPMPVGFDVSALQSRLAKQLELMGTLFQDLGERAIILVDGLDHVERERSVDRRFLSVLPRPEEIPEGVLFVVGTQSLTMLHSDIQHQLESPGRTIGMEGLGRIEVGEIAKAWDVGADADELWRISGGNPLILTYLLQQIRGLSVAEQSARLAALPEYGGDVEQLYVRLWSSIRDDDELVELLALVCRMRGAADLDWLRDRGCSAATVRRLRERFAHLFKRESERWYFFHDSLRLFLRDRTARLAGLLSESEDRRFHRMLAEMCHATPEGDPRAWELLFHLAAAGEDQRVLKTATPAFFRSQFVSLRPPELISEDIRVAARSLGEVHDPLALARIVIAASELSQRGYHSPDLERLLNLLVGTGRWRTALEHIAAYHPRPGEDNRTALIRVALLLHDEGLLEEAKRVFEENEPLDLFAGRADTSMARELEDLLYAWARTAAVLRGSDQVAETASKVKMPEDPFGRQRSDERSASVRDWMLAIASDELDARGSTGESDGLLDRLDLSQPHPRSAWLWALAERMSRTPEVAADMSRRIRERFTPDDLNQHDRVIVAEALFRGGDTDGARVWLEGALPTRTPPVRAWDSP